MKCYKRLIYKQFVQVSGLCGPQFLSYLPKRFTHLRRAICTNKLFLLWPREISKNIWSSLFLKKPFLFTRELAYVRINISSKTSNTWIVILLRIKRRDVFSETAFLFWCHALWKLGSSNCCIFEMKHATVMETCIEIYFLFIFNHDDFFSLRENNLLL